MSYEPDNHCRVCGLDHGYPKWGDDGRCPDFEICGCCGTEAGYEDYTIQSALLARKRWLEGGARWFDPRARPESWDLDTQMAQIPPVFRE